MYTAEDIRNVEFSKNMGGYKTAEVEAFVEVCAETVQALTAEKEELNKKLGILADKLVEYRRDEDSIRSALLSAQRMGDSVVRDAKDQADGIIAQANQKADEIVASAKASITDYENEISRLQNEVSDFKTRVLSLYKEHLALLKNVPTSNTDASTPTAAAVEAPVQVVEQAAQRDAEEHPEKSTRSKFANLKFGEDYHIDDDNDEEQDG